MEALEEFQAKIAGELDSLLPSILYRVFNGQLRPKEVTVGRPAEWPRLAFSFRQSG